MAEPLKTISNGREIELPSTIPGIRAALPEHRRAEFDRAVNEADVHEIHGVLRHWILELAEDESERAITARLRERERRVA
ncbi:hypothetical protein [Streptomyces sp. NPDC050504]|uniref:hypothetical protein n=1 Tax=Streptomyces sp. NPDC050504 TaxID=3365618 RepID=UPI0037AC6C51